MEDKKIREHVIESLQGGHAHITFDDAVAGFPAKLRGVKVEGAPHTAWELLEHMRVAQWDIVEFTRDPKHVSPDWPSGYWPKTERPPDAKAWTASVAAFRRDLKTMMKMVRDPKSDLLARIPHGTGQTMFREALLLADHNSYHLGQLMFLRKMLG